MRETLRFWLEGTETYVLEVILEQRQGKIAPLVRRFLHALSRVYGLIIKTRRFIYKDHIPGVKQPFGKRRYSFWKVVLVAVIISAWLESFWRF